MQLALEPMALPQQNLSPQTPRGIAVVDVGFTNCKVILYDQALNVLGEQKIVSPHHDGLHYREIDLQLILAFAGRAIVELDKILPVDAIVPCAHGACIVSLKADGSLAVPVMDYMSEPPPHIVAAYKADMPSFAESYSPLLPMALMHAMQLYWQSRLLPQEFELTQIILPLMQCVGFGLGGRAVTEVSSMSCQSHLVDMRDGTASSLSQAQGWDQHYAPLAKAWDVIGQFNGKSDGFRGNGNILAGVHDSNANFLRYLAAGQDHFTLLSTGTWVIGFDTDADMLKLDHARDIVANKSVFGNTVCCCRFFGGKEFEVLSQGASGNEASLAAVAKLLAQNTYALPSFTDSGGPMPGTGDKGHVAGPVPGTPEERASLASLYCALMVSESLDALHSQHTVIVDGPFSQNQVFLSVLAALRPLQTIMASKARDGTAAGAACLALMPSGKLPHVAVALRPAAPADLPGLTDYHMKWRALA
jgi:sugar (pentulose or hexulose) kinase